MAARIVIACAVFAVSTWAGAGWDTQAWDSIWHSTRVPDDLWDALRERYIVADQTYTLSEPSVWHAAAWVAALDVAISNICPYYVDESTATNGALDGYFAVNKSATAPKYMTYTNGCDRMGYTNLALPSLTLWHFRSQLEARRAFVTNYLNWTWGTPSLGSSNVYDLKQGHVDYIEGYCGSSVLDQWASDDHVSNAWDSAYVQTGETAASFYWDYFNRTNAWVTHTLSTGDFSSIQGFPPTVVNAEGIYYDTDVLFAGAETEPQWKDSYYAHDTVSTMRQCSVSLYGEWNRNFWPTSTSGALVYKRQPRQWYTNSCELDWDAFTGNPTKGPPSSTNVWNLSWNMPTGYLHTVSLATKPAGVADYQTEPSTNCPQKDDIDMLAWVVTATQTLFSVTNYHVHRSWAFPTVPAADGAYRFRFNKVGSLLKWDFEYE